MDRLRNKFHLHMVTFINYNKTEIYCQVNILSLLFKFFDDVRCQLWQMHDLLYRMPKKAQI